MGYLFENMEEMDIQAERRNTAEARKEAQQARQEAQQARQTAISAIIKTCRHFGASKEATIRQLCEEDLSLTEESAATFVAQYWGE